MNDNAPNGPICAAILAADCGIFVLGALTIAAEASKRLAEALTLYSPSGPLSGVTSLTIALWLVVWFVLTRLWKYRSLSVKWINLISFVLIGLGLLFTFPPVFAGK